MSGQFWSTLRRGSHSSKRSRSKGRSRSQAKRRKLLRSLQIEPLETRQLLAITSTLNGGVAVFTGDADANNLHLRINAPGELEFSFDGSSFSNDLDGSGGTLSLSSGSEICVNLGGGDDRLFVDKSLSNKLNDAGATLAFDGKDGTDILSGPDLENTWELTSGDGGGLNDRIAFAGVEQIVGGEKKDEVLVEFADGFGGVIDGGSGNLIVVAGHSIDTLHVNDIFNQGHILIGPDHTTYQSGTPLLIFSGALISRHSGSTLRTLPRAQWM